MQQLAAQTAEPSAWGELSQLCATRLQGQAQNRQEFESKAEVRGEVFLEQARPRIQSVQQGFDDYARCLEAIGQATQAEALPELAEQLKDTTHKLFAELDAYAAFYFAWGENQSPLVTMIRHAVESYSRSALQSTQAQRILSEMQEHFETQASKEDPAKAGEA